MVGWREIPGNRVLLFHPHGAFGAAIVILSEPNSKGKAMEVLNIFRVALLLLVLLHALDELLRSASHPPDWAVHGRCRWMAVTLVAVWLVVKAGPLSYYTFDLIAVSLGA